MGAEPYSRVKGDLPIGWNPISHAESMLSIPEINLVGLCDSDIDKCKKFSKLYNVGKYSTDYKELIEIIKPQIISVATRTQIRPDILNAAIHNDVKAIYCEKPLCNSIRDAENLIEKIKNKSIIMAYGTMRRYMPMFLKAREIINSGEIGELNEITIENGLSPLLWTHPHSTDLILFFAGNTDLDYVQGICNFSNGIPSLDEKIIDDDPLIEHAVFHFNNGVKGIIGKAKGFNVRIACSKGVLTIYGNATLMEVRKYSKEEPNYFNHVEQIPAWHCSSGTQLAFQEIINALKNNGTSPSPPEQILTGFKMLFAVVHSSLHEGKKVRFEEIDKDLFITGRTGQFYA